MSLTNRRSALVLLGAACATPDLRAAIDTGTSTPAPRKVLRVAFSSAETGFDPAMLSDLYSRTVTAHIFEALYEYDPLAMPAKVRPLTAAAMPEVSADHRVWTIRIRPGIHFADDPAFGGRPRELVAQDYVYALLRLADPALKAVLWSYVADARIVGLNAYRRQLDAGGGAWNPQQPIAGLRALDRYTLRIELERPMPRFTQWLAASDLLGAVAREVVERYGAEIAAHPVGTGPFRLQQWRRSSLIVLERNPGYRDVRYDAEPAPDDADGQAILARLKGRRLPMIDEVRIAIIEEEQPRWLSFVNGQLDAAAGQYGAVPFSFADVAMPGGTVAPHLARRGVAGRQQVNSDVGFLAFNMEDPVVGGYVPEKVALRRAIGLAYDSGREVQVVRRGQGVLAQSMVPYGTSGWTADFRSEGGTHDAARANALLDTWGYVDRDGDGWRENPDGSALVIDRVTNPEQVYRQLDDVWRRGLESIGLRTRFRTMQWAEALKAMMAGQVPVWSLAQSAAGPDGKGIFNMYDSGQVGQQNLARFRMPRMDALIERLGTLDDGPEREAVFDEAKRLSLAYMPYKPIAHRKSTDVWHPWLIGFRRPRFWQEWWHRVDLDVALREATQR